ncbi:MAG: hypothetical protein ACI4P0_00785, partial [Mailhella sp.]
GSSVRVTLTYASKEKSLPAIPQSAVQHDAEGAFVYAVTDDSRIQKKRVSLGPLTGNVQAVLSGISLHERIVCDGMHKVADGMLVECMETSESKQS